MTDPLATGTLAARPIPEQLAEMRRNRWTGMLLATNGGETRSVFVDAGRPVWATTDDPEQALAPYLCRRGLLSLGDAAADSTAVATQLPPAIAAPLAREHAEQLLLELFSWSRGTYAQHPLPKLPALDERLTSSPESILSRGLARVTSLELLRAGFGAPSTRMVAAAGPHLADLDADLAAETGIVLRAIRNGAATAPDWPSDFRLHQCVWELRLLGLIEATSGTDGVALAELLAGGDRIPAIAGDRAVHDDDRELAIPLDITCATVAPRGSSPPATAAAPVDRAARVPPIVKPAAISPAARLTTPPPISELDLGGRPELARAMEPTPLDLDAVGRLGMHGAPLDFDDREVRRRIDREAVQGPHAQVARLDTDELRRPPTDHHNGQNVTPLETADFGAPPTEAGRTPLLSAHEWFTNGVRFAREMDLYTAVRSFQEAVRLTPDNAVYRIELAKVMARNPKWRKEAEEHLLAAVDLNPFAAEAHLALARMYRKSGLMKRALARYRMAIDADGECREAVNEWKELTAQAAGAAGGAGSAQSLSGLIGRLSKLTTSDRKSPAPKGATGQDAIDNDEILA